MGCVHCGCPNPGPKCPNCDEYPYPLRKASSATRKNARPVGAKKVSGYAVFKEICNRILEERLKKQRGGER